MSKKIIVVGSGNAAMCAGIAALEAGAEVLMLEKADETLAGGNTKYTAGAMRFAYDGVDDLMPLLKDKTDPRLAMTDFGGYTTAKFSGDLLMFNGGRPLSPEQDHMELAAFTRLGGTIRYNSAVTGLMTNAGQVIGVNVGDEEIDADAVILACGGFEASTERRRDWMGGHWDKAKVRGTPMNTGDGLAMASDIGAQSYGLIEGCHATPMDLHMPDYANLDLPASERKNYRKICYFLGVMLNANGDRFVDEGENFRNYTYAQFGKAVLDQPGHFAWQIFDAKVDDLLYAEYSFHDAHYVQADTLDALCDKLEGVDGKAARATLGAFNDAVNDAVPFDPTSLDGKNTSNLPLPKSNWAQKIDTPPFKAYPVTAGITFTYGGLKVSDTCAVLKEDGSPIGGLFAAGEMVGGVFFEGYPGGSGLTSGAVFGRAAGFGAAG